MPDDVTVTEIYVPVTANTFGQFDLSSLSESCKSRLGHPGLPAFPENHRKTAEIKGKGSNNHEACFPNLDVTLREAERIVCPLDDITQEDGAFFPGPLHAHSIFPWRLSKTHKFDRPHFTGKWIGSAAAE